MYVHFYQYVYQVYHIPLFQKGNASKSQRFHGKFPKFSKALALQLLARQATGPRKARGAIESFLCRLWKIYVGCYIHRNLKRNVRGLKPKRCSFFSVFFGEAESLGAILEPQS